MPTGDVAALATRAFAAAFKIGMQLSAPFLVFGLVFNIGLGVLARLMPAMQVYFVGVPLSIMVGFLIFALVITAMMGTYLELLHRRYARADTAEIEHDPEKWMPVFPRDKRGTRFARRSCSNKS